MSKKKQNPKRVTEGQVLSGIKNKLLRMETEMQKNPNNTATAMRLAAFRKTHKSKLKNV